MYFYFLTISFLAGVSLSLISNFQLSDLLLFIPLVLALFLFKNNRLLSLLVIAALFVGIIRTESFLHSHNSHLLNKVGESVEVIGVIDDEPDKRENLTIYRVKTNEERIRIFVPHFPEYNFGNEVQIYGKLQKPENFKNENDVEFDYISYLEKDDIYTTMYYPKITLQDPEPSSGSRVADSDSLNLVQGLFNKIPFALFEIKHWLMNNMQRWLPSPHAPLAAGLILGAKQSLGKELLEQFRKVGLIHIVVLSGYNVTIIANTFIRLFSFLPRLLSFSLSIVAIIFFAIMSGASATIVRASVMAGVVLFADFIYRRYAVNRALFLAAAVMVFLNPRILLYDPGFQLSFVATFALIHLGNKLSQWFTFLPEKFEIREITSATLATQVAVLPMLVMMTGEISVVALVVNLLVLPTVPFAMLFGFIPSLIFFNAGILGSLISFPAYVLLSYEIWVVKLFSALPFAVWRF